MQITLTLDTHSGDLAYDDHLIAQANDGQWMILAIEED